MSDEELARLINGLVEAGDLLMLHVQRIDWNPAAADMARECWMESRAKLSGDDTQKRWPDDWPPRANAAASRGHRRDGGASPPGAGPSEANPRIDGEWIGTTDGGGEVYYARRDEEHGS